MFDAHHCDFGVCVLIYLLSCGLQPGESPRVEIKVVQAKCLQEVDPARYLEDLGEEQHFCPPRRTTKKYSFFTGFSTFVKRGSDCGCRW